jgi:hypothetical protein
MRRFQSIDRSHRVLKKGRIVPAACRAVIVRSRKIVMDQNDIRRHPSRFLHELGDFGPRPRRNPYAIRLAAHRSGRRHSRGPRTEIIEPGPGTPT